MSNLGNNTSVPVYPSSTISWPSQSYAPTSTQQIYEYAQPAMQNTGRHSQASGSSTISRGPAAYNSHNYHRRSPNYSSQFITPQPFTPSAPTFTSTSTSTLSPSNSIGGYQANAAWSTIPSAYATTLPATATPSWPANTNPTSPTEQYVTAEQLELISPKDAARYVKVFCTVHTSPLMMLRVQKAVLSDFDLKTNKVEIKYVLKVKMKVIPGVARVVLIH